MRRTFLAILGLPLIMAMLINQADAGIVIDLTSSGTGAGLDEAPLSGATTSVVEDLSGLLDITVTGVSSVAAGSDINATGTSLGINAAGADDTDALDFDTADQLFVSFNLDVFVENVDLENLIGAETFTAGTQMGIDDNNTNGSDIFDFTGGGATQGIFLPAGTTFLLETTGPAGGSVGIQAIHVAIAAVPEPSSLALLAGFAGLFASKRRRR